MPPTIKETGSEARQAEATIIADMERRYRDWKAFIREQQSVLQHRLRAAGDIDDLTARNGTGQDDAVFVATISSERRREFQAVLEQRRRQLQADRELEAKRRGDPHPDTDTVLDELLEQITNELDGQAHPRGLSLIWANGRLYEFDARSVRSASHDDDWMRLKRKGASSPAQTWGVVAGVVVLLLVGGWYLWGILFPSPSAGSTAGTPRIQSGDATYPLFAIDTVRIGGRQLTAPRVTNGYPLLLCVPSEAQSVLTPGTTVTLSGTDNLRTYVVNAGDAEPRDLLLAHCAEKQPPQVGAAAHLMETHTVRYLDPALLVEVQTWLPAIDPQHIPSGMVRVDLTLRGEGLEGRLLLSDGTPRAPTTSVVEAGMTTFSYLLDHAAQPRLAVWRKKGDDPAMEQLLPFTIPPPQGREGWIQETVSVTEAQATVRRRDDGTVQVTLDLVVESSHALTLHATDLVLEQSQADVTCTARDNPDAPLQVAPGTLLALTCSGEGFLEPPLDIHLGGWFARLTF
jgi:hypothetical protein